MFVSDEYVLIIGEGGSFGELVLIYGILRVVIIKVGKIWFMFCLWLNRINLCFWEGCYMLGNG